MLIQIFRQFSLAGVHSLIVKKIIFQGIQFVQIVVIQTILFRVSTVLMPKTVLFQTI